MCSSEAEQVTVNHPVVGSIPATRANKVHMFLKSVNRVVLIGESSKGRTMASDAIYIGSNPISPSKIKQQIYFCFLNLDFITLSSKVGLLTLNQCIVVRVHAGDPENNNGGVS